MSITKLKEKIKERFGDKYLEFMTDLSNISLTHKAISEKWKLNATTLSNWVDVLGYVHTGDIKKRLRNQYRIEKRVRAREETGRQMLELLKRRKNFL